jgi:hypothetical protein
MIVIDIQPFNYFLNLLCLFLQSITFDKFYIQGYGVDARGFLTSTLSMNSSVKLNFRNTGTFFRVHVTSIPLDLYYYQLPLATGNVSLNKSIIICSIHMIFFNETNQSLCIYV